MTERIVKITGDEFPAGLPAEASAVVRDGGVLIHPTATIHGYGCRFDMNEPVERIRRYKGRDSSKPMIVLVPSSDWLDRLCYDIPEQARKLAGKFWPGGLTLILNASSEFKDQCCWPSATVALRQCAHPFTARMLNELNIPLVSTSLGHSGEPVPLDSLEFARSLNVHSDSNGIEAPEISVIDSELDVARRPSSTLLDLSCVGEVKMLRAGAISRESIEQTAGHKVEFNI